MRSGTIVLLLLAMGCSACGKTVRTLSPVTETVALSYGNYFGKIQLANGSELAVNAGRLVGPWFCGGVSPSGPDVCVRRSEVTALIDEQYRPGAEAVLLIPMSLFAAVWIGTDEWKARERRKADARDAELRRRGVLPPLPTAEQRRRRGSRGALLSCLNVPFPERKAADAEGLAERVWSEREQCLGPAAGWFFSHGDPDKGRRLSFIAAARQRYELFVCRGLDPGFAAPPPSLIDADAPDWMEEYRAVATDSRTYEFKMKECEGEGTEQPVLRQVLSSFTLTDPALLKAAVACQSHRR